MAVRPNRGWQGANALLFLAATLFVVFEYTFLHEGGHALAGVLSGAKISAFSLRFWTLDAYVGVTGTLTPAQTVANNLAGAALPLIAWLAYVLALPRGSTFVLESVRAAASLMVLSTLLAWIALPILYLAGSAPSDDVVNFLANSRVQPLLVSGAALLCFVGGWALVLAKVGGLSRELGLLRAASASVVEPATRRALSAVAGVAVLCGLVAFAANGFSFATADRAYQPPQGYAPVARVDLAVARDQSTLCEFTLDRPAAVGVLLIVEEVKSDYLEVRLTGPSGYDKVVVHAEGYTASRDTPRLEAALPPGRYTCVVTNRPSSGAFELLVKIAE